MGRNLLILVLIVALLASGSGCATTNPDGTPSRGAAAVGGMTGGALLGAALGAIIGAATGNVARGAAIGAAAGALAGGLAGVIYGNYQEKLARDRQAAEAEHKYNPEQGEKVVVESVSVQPEEVAQGQNVGLYATYTVLTGSDEAVAVEVTQRLVSQGKAVGRANVIKAEKVSGTYELATPAAITARVPPGTYALITQVKTANAKDEKSCEFTVARKAAPEPAPQETQQPRETEG